MNTDSWSTTIVKKNFRITHDINFKLESLNLLRYKIFFSFIVEMKKSGKLETLCSAISITISQYSATSMSKKTSGKLRPLYHSIDIRKKWEAKASISI